MKSNLSAPINRFFCRRLSATFLLGLLTAFLCVFVETSSAQGQPAATPPDLKRKQSKLWADQAFRLYEQDKVAAAIKLYQRAANAGDLNSAYNLAVIRITDEDKRLPLASALRYLNQAASGNYGLAQHMLGSLYEQGRHVERSQKNAFDWFERAAKNNVKEAYSDVATQYYLGRGIKQDYSKSAYWYDKAAEAGDGSAQYILASMYETGLGVPEDLRIALVWYTAAARQGDEAANAKAKDVVKKISAQQPVVTK